MEKDILRVVVKMADGTRYEGDISLHGHERVVDTLNHIDTFFHLRDVKLDTGEILPLVVVNKSHVATAWHLAPPREEIDNTLVLRKGNQPKSVFRKS